MIFLKEKCVYEYEISKSRFIGVLIPVVSNKDIPALVAELRNKHPKANHFCYGCVTGEHGEYHNSSDDGEPSGTAGVPILNVLKHKNITNCLCVVIRYFGGIKLGAGGLIRAYAKATSISLENALFYTIKKVPTYQLTFDYSLIDKLEHLINNNGFITNKEFGENCIYTLYLDNLNVFGEIEHLFINKEYLGETILEIDLS